MPRGYVCGCGTLSLAPKCPECQAKRDDARAYYFTPHWRKLAAACKARDGECVACGSGIKLVAHHIIAREPVPYVTELDQLGNLATLCTPCHSTLEADRRNGNDAHGLVALTMTLRY